MSNVRTSTGSAVTSIMGLITTSASTIAVNVDSLAHLSAAGNHKARYYAKAVEDNCKALDKLNRAVTHHNNAKGLTDLKIQIAKSLEDPTYKALYEESLRELA